MSVYALFWLVLRLVLTGRGRYTTGVTLDGLPDHLTNIVDLRNWSLGYATLADHPGDRFVVFTAEPDRAFDDEVGAL